MKEISELSLSDITERLSTLDKEVREMKTVESIELATEQKKALLERKTELETLEKRKQQALGLQQGELVGKRIGGLKMEEQRTFSVDSAEYRSAYLKALQGKELDKEERAAVTGTAVIPTTTLNKIIEKLEQTSALYSKITVLNIPSNLTLPVENAKADASWVSVGTASTDSVDSFATAATLGAYALIKTIEITADVAAMSIDVFESFIVNALYKKLAKAVENAILNGTGSNQPTGLLKSGEITTTTTYTKAAMTFKDLMKIIAQLGTMYLPGATFVMPKALFYGDVLGMVDSTGNRVVVADPTAPAKFSILGYPVIVDDYMTADTVLFGDLSYYYWNWVKNVEVTSDKSVGFRSGSTVYRAMALADGKKVLADAFCTATRSAT